MLQNLKEFVLIPVQFFQSATKLTYVSLGIAAVIGLLHFKIFFRKRDGFNDLPKDLTQPTDYQWFKLKLIVLAMICAGSYRLAYHQLPGWFPFFSR
jgi:hypothetical protein